MSEYDTKVVGYFAFGQSSQVFRHENACVVAGTLDDMERYLTLLPPDAMAAMQIKKLRFGDIRSGLDKGGTYTFDEQAYRRFYPLASRAGIDVVAPSFVPGEEGAWQFLKVALST